MPIAAFEQPDSDWQPNLIHRGTVYEAMPMKPGSHFWQVCDVAGTVAMSGPQGSVACGEEQAKRIAAEWNRLRPPIVEMVSRRQVPHALRMRKSRAEKPPHLHLRC